MINSISVRSIDFYKDVRVCIDRTIFRNRITEVAIAVMALACTAVCAKICYDCCIALMNLSKPTDWDVIRFMGAFYGASGVMPLTPIYILIKLISTPIKKLINRNVDNLYKHFVNNILSKYQFNALASLKDVGRTFKLANDEMIKKNLVKMTFCELGAVREAIGKAKFTKLNQCIDREENKKWQAIDVPGFDLKLVEKMKEDQIFANAFMENHPEIEGIDHLRLTEDRCLQLLLNDGALSDPEWLKINLVIAASTKIPKREKIKLVGKHPELALVRETVTNYYQGLKITHKNFDKIYRFALLIENIPLQKSIIQQLEKRFTYSIKKKNHLEMLQWHAKYYYICGKAETAQFLKNSINKNTAKTLYIFASKYAFKELKEACKDYYFKHQNHVILHWGALNCPKELIAR